MRAVVQRVLQANVSVGGTVLGAIERGLLVLVGVGTDDDGDDVAFLCRKLLTLRIFDDPEGRMGLSVTDVGGELLLISQFTLFGDCRKGTRPSYSRAAPPELAEDLYEQLAGRIRMEGVPVKMGQFRARMEVSSINEGPVTLVIDSKKSFY
jgi:D-tyrosyl-tRNA(Tyr) deacylase